ncbi:thioredoxin-like [Chionomys nivalis]|uniref:thioredoxin-like n=1 Tax=Chionomys nivalis TaxID=269649 RepID=UPI00259637C1|nr:thioredoxin-like [Chionomys nivalis]
MWFLPATAKMVKLIESKEAFQEALAAAGDKLVVVDFSATWCGPCKMIKPFFHSLSEKYSSVVLLEIDVVDCQDAAAECEVKCMPTFQFYKKGQKVGEFSGANKEKLEASITELLRNHALRNIISQELFKTCNFFNFQNMKCGESIPNCHLIINEDKVLILPFLKPSGVLI